MNGFVQNDPIASVDHLGKRVADLEIKADGGNDFGGGIKFKGRLGSTALEKIHWAHHFDDLGFASGKVKAGEFNPGNNAVGDMIDGLKPEKEYSGGLLKWRAKARWVCAKGNAKFKQWASNVNMDALNGEGQQAKAIHAFVGPASDGPAGQQVSRLSVPGDYTSRELANGESTYIWAWDAPRIAVPTKEFAGKQVRVSGHWRLRVEDNENAWETEFNILFVFNVDLPQTGVGRLVITVQPHEVKK